MIDHFPHVVSGEMCRCFAHVAAPQATPPIAKSGMRNAECGMLSVPITLS
jgi:hypothetical protein